MKKIINLKDIELDKKNPRFITRKNENENVANFMIKHTKKNHIDDMVKDILNNGLSPLDTIGVFLENDKYIALDGNRRILSLKIIYEFHNINIPESITSIKNQYADLINNKRIELTKNLNVYVFDNRDEAKKWLNRKHTNDFRGASAQDWPTLEKKIFQKNPLAILISNEADAANISYDNYAINIKYTIWERFFVSSFSRKWLGVEYSKENKHYKILNHNQLHERMNAIVKAYENNDLNFTLVNKKRDKSKTIKTINKKYLINSKFEKNISIEKSKPKNSTKIKFFITENMPKKIKDILNECNGINYSKKFFLSTIILRPILEYIINYYYWNNIEQNSTKINKQILKDKAIIVIKKLINDANSKKFNMFWIKNNEYERIINHLNWTIHVSDDDWLIEIITIKNTIEGINLILKAIWKEN